VPIREAKSSDQERILTLDRIAEGDRIRASFIARAVQLHTCVLAENANELIGYAVLEYTFYEQGFVSMVYVAEPARRRGVGRSLLENLEKRCSRPKLFTSTNESNREMKSLLMSLGYTASGVIYNLDPGDPELVFFKKLEKNAYY